VSIGKLNNEPKKIENSSLIKKSSLYTKSQQEIIDLHQQDLTFSKVISDLINN
jgi:hypothetical protein